MRPIAAALLLVAIPAAGYGGGPAVDEEAPRLSTLSEHVRVDVVLLEVVVLDRSGHHLRGLSRENFKISERGEEVAIGSFDEIDLTPVAERAKGRAERRRVASSGEAPGAGATPAEAEVTTRPEPAAVPAPVGRKFVLLFDTYHNPSALRLVQIRREALRFVREQLLPVDQVAVYELAPYLKSLTPFTNDAIAIEEAIAGIRYMPGESLATQITDATVYHGYHGTRDDVETRIRGSAEFGANQALAEQRTFFESLEVLGELLEGDPSKKLVLLFSGGFPMLVPSTERSTLGFTHGFRRMIRQLERSRASVYTFSIGEETVLADASQSSSYRDTLDYLGFGQDFLDRIGGGLGPGGDSALAQNQILAVLALESGGRFFPGRDYGRALRATSDDTTHYYLIGYTPPSSVGRAEVRDRYQTIDVKLVGVKGEVRARRGRFLDEGDERPVALARQELGDVESNPVSKVATSAAEPAPPAVEEIPRRLELAPVQFPGGSGRTLVALPMQIVGPVRPVVQVEGGLALDLSVRVSASAGGVEIDHVERNYRAVVGEDRLEGLKAGLRINEAIELAPGAYEIAASVRLNGLGIEVDARQAITVERFDDRGLGLSAIVPVAGDEAPPLVADVFTASRTEGETTGFAEQDPFALAGTLRVLATPPGARLAGSPLTVFFRLFDVTLDASGTRPAELSLEWRLVPEGGGDPLLPPVELVYFRPTPVAGTFDVVAHVNLSDVVPGPYDLFVDARDLSAMAATSRRISVVAP